MKRFAMRLALVFLGSMTAWAVPGKPVMQSPAVGDCPERRPVIKWDAAEGAVQYLLRITRNGSPYLEKATRKTTWTPAADLPEGLYEVRVVGYDGAAYGKWSLPVQFRRVFSPYLASVNGLRRDGANIELVAGPGIAIEEDSTNLAIVITAVGTGDYELGDLAVTTTKLADGSVTSGKIADGTIVNADIAAGAAILDAKLATISTAGKVANSATTATSGNTGNAIVARDASGNFSAGTISATAFSGGGASLTGLNAAQLASGTVPDARLPANLARSNQVWLLGGNAGTTPGTHYLGTSDNHPLEIKVNGLRAIRLEDNGDSADSGTVRDGAPNIILGSPANWVETGAVGSAIGGGGATNHPGLGRINSISSDYSVIGGGLGNTIQSGSDNSTLGGGFLNMIQATSDYATVGGGFLNMILTNAPSATVGGGQQNVIQASANHSTIGGGQQNVIEVYSAVSTISGGYLNTIQTNADYSTIGGGQRNSIRVLADESTIGGGVDNTIHRSAQRATIGGGVDNTIQESASRSTIAGSYYNTIQSYVENAFIGGGYMNTIMTNANFSTISGGDSNDIRPLSENGTIGGGKDNMIAYYVYNCTIGGGVA